MRWRSGCGGSRRSARSPSNCSTGRSSAATFSSAASPEPIAEIKRPEWSATLYDLLSAYAARRQTQARSFVRVPKRTVWSLAEAREALERLIGQSMDWSPLDQYLIAYLVEPSMAATVLASSFAAALELVREGRLEVHQQGPLRRSTCASGRAANGGSGAAAMAAESGNG